MSLYYEAASILTNADSTGGSLKSRIFNKKDLKSKPAQVFALVTEASKWSGVLKDVVEKSGLLKEERKLTPVLALLLTHDLLLSKGGVAAPANHVLKLAITRHKARLNAELVKLRIKRGCGSLEQLREQVNSGGDETTTAPNGSPAESIQHPRWVRINALRTSLDTQLSTTFVGYNKADDLAPVLSASGSSKLLYLDPHIPNLIALPPRADFAKSPAYLAGQIIFQDKASCFPAYLLDVQPEDEDIIDACAAPGNKTTHLSAILSERVDSGMPKGRAPKIFAYEKDKRRSIILDKMVKIAGADKNVRVKVAKDFLATKPDSLEMEHVRALLLDPSCSGSGIVGRDDSVKVYLPDPKSAEATNTLSRKSKKRKRPKAGVETPETPATPLEVEESAPEIAAQDGTELKDRLKALSTFQLHLLTHAMRFPNARKITYSTCSIHFEENEGVVFGALTSPIAKERGWKILLRDEQVDGMRKWEKRGIWEEDKFDGGFSKEKWKADVLDGCIRCEKGTEEGTMGFFAAALVRDSTFEAAEPASEVIEENGEEEEWSGFSDDDTGPSELATVQAPASTKVKKLKHKR
ncbi:S-adenosyl-L-methionine-dependent methyltransferase [Mytilinidion resinicola]|uniref:S-adenosyl-L-methionine-dependent methyltransferase n=1 Tax=Mytilinidion resinicola TaxID=574789 RepID=A0A6A6Z689_9PEZI|nr:S-adenosyl-L-methionine-dependent methyltransferase [Mytilinidion resinicola]KAF2816550.1 S-adenosyl-L-methionine-dependent methyltransferase [Mytilinidion resinicola]